MASARAGVLASVYSLDVNADGVIDRDELERGGGRRGPGLGLQPGFVAALREADTDGNGRIDIAEILALARRLIDERQPPFHRFEPWLEDFVPLALDRDGDGRVTREELDSAVREAFAAIDSDGDGRLSEAELRTATAGTPNPLSRARLVP